MTLRVGINGFGRMGRLVMRVAAQWDDICVVHINDPAGNAASLAHLLNFDSVHGRWQREATAIGDELRLGKETISTSRNQGHCTDRLVRLRPGCGIVRCLQDKGSAAGLH